MSNQPKEGQSFSALDQFHEWNEVTGVPEKGTGWYFELESIFEDADKELALLRVEAATQRTQSDFSFDEGELLRDKIAELRALLACAKCPDEHQSGHQREEPCQWCYEREQACPEVSHGR